MSAVLLCALSAHADNNLPYLSSIPIERAHTDNETPSTSSRSTLHVNDTGRSTLSLSAIDGLQILSTDEHTISVEFVDRPTVSGDVEEAFRSSTFVIDFDEDSIRSLLDDLMANFDETPSVQNLVTFVYEHIEDKTYSRSFDLASQVATNGAGDCTEHAVLLAALARASGYYARIAFGTLIVELDSGLYAFGHAWAEIHDGEDWQIRDATLPESQPDLRQLRYLPVALLNDEGPGYSLSLIDAVSSFPTRITETSFSD